MTEVFKPTQQQIINCQSMGWEYDPESFLFEKDGTIGYFTEKDGFIKI